VRPPPGHSAGRGRWARTACSSGQGAGLARGIRPNGRLRHTDEHPTMRLIAAVTSTVVGAAVLAYAISLSGRLLNVLSDRPRCRRLRAASRRLTNRSQGDDATAVLGGAVFWTKHGDRAGQVAKCGLALAKQWSVDAADLRNPSAGAGCWVYGQSRRLCG